VTFEIVPLGITVAQTPSWLAWSYQVISDKDAKKIQGRKIASQQMTLE
jgi:hypothetical protein